MLRVRDHKDGGIVEVKKPGIRVQMSAEDCEGVASSLIKVRMSLRMRSLQLVWPFAFDQSPNALLPLLAMALPFLLLLSPTCLS